MTTKGLTREELLALPATVDLPTAGQAIGIGRNQAYDLAARGEFPCRVLKLGKRYRVVTSELLDLVGVHKDGTEPDAKATGGPVTVRSINALVGRNLAAARGLRGLTQDQLGQLLEPVTGRSWSKATISALERSGEGGRPREFDADDLVALAKVLDVPLLFLFQPAASQPNDRWVARSVTDDAPVTDSDVVMDAADLAEVLHGRRLKGEAGPERLDLADRPGHIMPRIGSAHAADR